MKYPAVIHMTDDWINGLDENLVGVPTPPAGDEDVPVVVWAPARPEPFYRKWGRLKAAWLVFTGRADALVWPGQ